MRLSLSVLIVCIVSFEVFAGPSAGSQSILSVINNSGSPIQISYLKTTKGPLLKKLIEQGEAITFGVVHEAMISGVGIIGKYTTPEPFRFFPPNHARTSAYCIAKVEGTKNKSITKPFGDWNIKYVFAKSLERVLPAVEIPPKDMIIKAFPTAVRMNVPTPRFILGLPEGAALADANEAESLLSEKWSSVKTSNSEETKILNSIIDILNKAREAFELNKPDEPLSELVSPRTSTLALAE